LAGLMVLISEVFELWAVLLRRRYFDGFFVVLVEVAGVTGSRTWRNVRRFYLHMSQQVPVFGGNTLQYIEQGC